MSDLSVCHQGLTGTHCSGFTAAASRQDAWEDDAVQVSLTQPLASMPVGAALVPNPRRGEGALQANRGGQGGGAGASLPLTGLPLTLSASDGRVVGAGLCDTMKGGRYLDIISIGGAPITLTLAAEHQH